MFYYHFWLRCLCPPTKLYLYSSLHSKWKCYVLHRALATTEVAATHSMSKINHDTETVNQVKIMFYWSLKDAFPDNCMVPGRKFERISANGLGFIAANQKLQCDNSLGLSHVREESHG